MQAWEEFLLEQESSLGKDTVEKWLRPLKISRFDACNLYLEASDSFKALWFEEHMRKKIQSSLFNNNNSPIKVHIAVKASEQLIKKTKKDSYLTEKVKTEFEKSDFSLSFSTLDQDQTFAEFIPTEENSLAYKLLCDLCGLDSNSLEKINNSPVCFNPIYIFGRSGTGKTHLLNATAIALKERGYHVVYVNAEQFTNHVVSAIRVGEMQKFRKVYRQADALLIDDIEVFSRKGATQEELFHTFNTLHVNGKQIILTASCPPQELKFIEPRLISRFEWGIAVFIQMLSKNHMKEALHQKLSKTKLILEEETSKFLLSKFETNTKKLSQAIEQLALRLKLRSGGDLPLTSVSIKDAELLLTDLIEEEEKAILSPAKIIRTVAEFYGVRMEDILGKSQARECALPRQVAMHLCRTKLELPFMKIGDIFSRDHSTVMTSVKQIQKNITHEESEIKTSVSSIIKLLEH